MLKWETSDRLTDMMEQQDRIPAHKRALALWLRCWQLAGGRWPPTSRAIAQQIVLMVRNALLDSAAGRLSEQDANIMARETMASLTAQSFTGDDDHQAVVEELTDVLLEAEIGEWLVD
ncbi:MAG: hypothetical protein R3300_12055 [Candidatus Promineifilaceae bacterium]|nr:hypothetical protein [Candidatus Promineifilaceae bacterium]